LPGGASYALLVIPDRHALQPNSTLMSLAITKKLLQLAKDGATILINKNYLAGIGLHDNNDSVKLVMSQLLSKGNKKGRIIFTPYTDSSFVKLGLQKDVEILDTNHSIAWTHRKVGDDDIYFVSNQKDEEQLVEFSFRKNGKMPEIFNPVTNTIWQSHRWIVKNGRTIITERLDPNESLFIVFRKNALEYKHGMLRAAMVTVSKFPNKWKMTLDKNFDYKETSIVFDSLTSWSVDANIAIKYYSGTAVYTNTFPINSKDNFRRAIIQFDSMSNIATIKVNGIDCGTLWTKPYELDITKALKVGNNKIEISVTNTWHNRLIGDNLLPIEKRITWTTAPFRLKDKPLLPAGIIGDVKITLRY
jgi:alpha-L-rhamnosidase/Glycosyl hydrolases family 2, sugar binding domain